MLTVHSSGEPIGGNTVPGALERTQRALNAFDRFVFAYEDDYRVFEAPLREGRAAMLMFAVDDKVFYPRRSYAERARRALFAGKITDFGIAGKDIYGLRARLGAALVAENLLDVHYDPSATTDQVCEAFSSRVAMVNLPGIAGVVTGYSRKVFECLGCRTLLVQPRQAADSLSGRILREGAHYLAFDPRDPDELKRVVRQVMDDPARFEAVAAAGHQEALLHHTIERRAEQLLRFIADGVPPHAADGGSPYEAAKRKGVVARPLPAATPVQGGSPPRLAGDSLSVEQMQALSAQALPVSAAEALLWRRLHMLAAGVNCPGVVFSNFLTRTLGAQEWANANGYRLTAAASPPASDGAPSSDCGAPAVIEATEASVYLWRRPSGEISFMPFGRDRAILWPDPATLGACPFLKGPDEEGRYIAELAIFQRHCLQGKYFLMGGDDDEARFLTDCLPRQQLLEQHPERRNYTLVVDKLTAARREMMEFMGIDAPVLEIGAADPRALFEFEHLAVPVDHPLPERMRYLRRRLALNGSMEATGRTICLAQTEPRGAARLADLGCRVVAADQLALREEQELIWGADVVVCQPGLESLNFQIFGRPNAILVQTPQGCGLKDGALEDVAAAILRAQDAARGG